MLAASLFLLKLAADINEAVSVEVLTSTEIRQVIQGLTVSLLPPEEVGVLDPVSHRIKEKNADNRGYCLHGKRMMKEHG